MINILPYSLRLEIVCQPISGENLDIQGSSTKLSEQDWPLKVLINVYLVGISLTLRFQGGGDIIRGAKVESGQTFI